MQDYISQSKDQFEKVMDRFAHDLSSVRTGRANPSLLATVMVDSYGAKVPLNNVANVTVSDATTLTITPWDQSQIPAIEKGIQVANLGLATSNDGKNVRINLPAMTEDRRKEMVKLVKQIAETARVGIRQVREEIMKQVKKAEKNNEATEDDVAEATKKVQKVVDDYNDQIKEVSENKEKELMTV